MNKAISRVVLLDTLIGGPPGSDEVVMVMVKSVPDIT